MLIKKNKMVFYEPESVSIEYIDPDLFQLAIIQMHDSHDEQEREYETCLVSIGYSSL